MNKKVSLRFFFEQVGDTGCGVCVVNTILKKYDLRGLIFLFTKKKGTSSKRIICELRKAGLKAKSKTISIRNLKEWSILWYPPRGKRSGDHYVVVGEIKNGMFLIYDSEKKEPYWEEAPALKKKWYRWYHNRWCGWVIEVRKPNGKG